MTVKIGDLGLSKLVENYDRMIGDDCRYYWSYMSPEAYKGECLNSKSDVWSLGCVIYEMIRLEKLFNSHGKTFDEMIDEVLNQFNEYDENVTISNQMDSILFKPILHSMLKLQLESRLDSNELLLKINVTIR